MEERWRKRDEMGTTLGKGGRKGGIGRCEERGREGKGRIDGVKERKRRRNGRGGVLGRGGK